MARDNERFFQVNSWGKPWKGSSSDRLKRGPSRPPTLIWNARLVKRPLWIDRSYNIYLSNFYGTGTRKHLLVKESGLDNDIGDPIGIYGQHMRFLHVNKVEINLPTFEAGRRSSMYP